MEKICPQCDGKMVPWKYKMADAFGKIKPYQQQVTIYKCTACGYEREE